MRGKWLACFGCAVLLLTGCVKEENLKNGGSSIQFQDLGSEMQQTPLNILIMHSEKEAGIWQGWGAKKLQEDLGIKLEIFPTSMHVNEEMCQYLMSGQLPDVISMGGEETIQMYLDAGVLLPLENYKEKLPNIFERKEYSDAIRFIEEHKSNGTGQVYLLPTSVGPTDYHSFNWVPLLQWDAYKKIGMPEIHTLEDYLDVVEDMVAYKPVTGRGEKVYGFSLFSEWDELAATEVSTLSYLYGIDTRYVSPLMETNVITGEINSLLSDQSFYKRALKFYFEANQRGLLDPDSMTQKYSDVEKKFSNGRVMFSWFSWMYGDYNSDERQNDQKNPDGMASVVAEDMKLYKAPDSTIGGAAVFGILKNSKNLDAALEFLNWLYDPQIQAYLTNGPEGVTWGYNENGQPEIINWEIIENPTKDLIPESVGGGCFDDGRENFGELGLEAALKLENGYSLSYRYWPSTLERNPTRMKQEVKEMLGGMALPEYLYKNHMVAQSTQAVHMIGSPNKELQSKINQIGEKVKTYSWKMVYAVDEEEFEQLWYTMTKEANDLGMSDVVNYYIQAWEEAQILVGNYEGG